MKDFVYLSLLNKLPKGHWVESTPISYASWLCSLGLAPLGCPRWLIPWLVWGPSAGVSRTARHLFLHEVLLAKKLDL